MPLIWKGTDFHCKKLDFKYIKNKINHWDSNKYYSDSYQAADINNKNQGSWVINNKGIVTRMTPGFRRPGATIVSPHIDTFC